MSLTIEYADVVELVDTHALGACASRREGSSPFIRTKFRLLCLCIPITAPSREVYIDSVRSYGSCLADFLQVYRKHKRQLYIIHVLFYFLEKFSVFSQCRNISNTIWISLNYIFVY